MLPKLGSSTRRAGIAAAVVAVMLLAPAAASAQAPVVSVWYRGTPAGTPTQSELGAIRALGFHGVIWPRANTAGLAEMNRLAAIVGLKVTVANRPVAMTARSALAPPARVDVVITPATAGMVTALAWRAVAHGAREISFDGGATTGAGLEDASGSLKPWVRAAISLARQLGANSNLVALLRPGPALTVTPAAASLDVVFLDAGKTWVIVATNTSAARIAAAVRLPKGVPYALWVSWLEGPPLAMLSEPAGPRWMVTMAPHSAQVYIIDKAMK